MLQSLKIKNLALIESELIEFDRGLNVFLGETGSGKSLIFDAISFVTGQKSDKTLLRTGSDQMKVDAIFTCLSDATKQLLRSYEIEDEDILLSRTMAQDGRTSFRLNGEPVTAAMVKNISKTLLDSMVQHESMELLKSKNHLFMLDKFGGNEIAKIKENFNEVLLNKKELKNRIDALGGSDETRERTLELLSFQISEIEKADLNPGEDDEIRERLNLMENAEKFVEASRISETNLSRGDTSALSKINEVISTLNSLPENQIVSECSDRLTSIRYELDDIAETLNDLKNDVCYDEIEYNRLDSRLDLIKSLKKKYGKTIEDVLSYLDEIKNKYNDLIGSDELITKLSRELKSVNEKLNKIATDLSQKRKDVALMLEEKIVNELKDLGMKGTTFKVKFETKDLSGDGIDDVEFVFSANKGQEVKNLAKTASGGEASRIMLAIKNIFSSLDGVGTLLFDEVDAGISGEIGNMVAKKLENISKSSQVLCITHLAQVAALSDHFYLVKKEVVNDITISNIQKIDESDAVEEIAKLTGGKVSESAISHAKELRSRKMSVI